MRGRRLGVVASVGVLNMVGFAVLVAEQAIEWSAGGPAAPLIWWVGGVTLVIGLVLVAAILLLAVLVRLWWLRLGVGVGLVVVQALVRTLLLLPAIAADGGPPAAVVWATGMTGYSVALGAGLLVGALLVREDRERERREAEEGRARQAIAELEGEELRVRRMVADRLHGTVQHRLVVIASGLDHAAADLEGSGSGRWVPTLREWAADLDELREEQVRSLSHSLFPSGADLGTYEAICALLDRLPTSVATTVVLGPRMRDIVHEHGSPLPLVDRLVAVYAVEEAVTNALKHGRAEAVTVTIEIAQDTEALWMLDVTVDDDGSGPPAGPTVLSGLARHRSRAEARGGSLELTRSPVGGARLHLVLPFVPETGQPAVAPASPGTG